MPKPAPASSVRIRGLHLATLATLLCGLVITFLLFSLLRDSEQKRSAFDFERRTQARVAAVTGGFDDAAEATRAINVLFGSTATVSEAQFQLFAAPLLAAHPYIRGLVFFRFVTAAERSAYEARAREEWPQFEIRERAPAGFVPARQRRLHLALDKIAPVPRNRVAHGYDVWAYPPVAGWLSARSARRTMRQAA